MAPGSRPCSRPPSEQNVARSLSCCDRAYVLEIGRIVLSGAADALRESEAVRKAYLGG
jgi:branched-chain amino acid transport system ATP-binding protein